MGKTQGVIFNIIPPKKAKRMYFSISPRGWLVSDFLSGIGDFSIGMVSFCSIVFGVSSSFSETAAGIGSFPAILIERIAVASSGGSHIPVS